MAQLSAKPFLISLQGCWMVFLEADGSGRSLFASVGATGALAPLQLWLLLPVEMGMAGGGRALVTSLLCGTSATAAHGGLGAKWPREMTARAERARASQTKLADEIFVLREGQDAATGSHLREDTSRLGGRLQELCLCLGWPSGRHGTEGGGMAAIWFPL